MKYKLWVLIDKFGNVLYTGKEQFMCENYKEKMNYNFNTFVIELKGML